MIEGKIEVSDFVKPTGTDEHWIVVWRERGDDLVLVRSNRIERRWVPLETLKALWSRDLEGTRSMHGLPS